MDTLGFCKHQKPPRWKQCRKITQRYSSHSFSQSRKRLNLSNLTESRQHCRSLALKPKTSVFLAPAFTQADRPSFYRSKGYRNFKAFSLSIEKDARLAWNNISGLTDILCSLHTWASPPVLPHPQLRLERHEGLGGLVSLYRRSPAPPWLAGYPDVFDIVIFYKRSGAERRASASLTPSLVPSWTFDFLECESSSF